MELYECPGAADLVIGLLAAGVSELRSVEDVLAILNCLPDDLNTLPRDLREHPLLGDLGRPPQDLARVARGCEVVLADVLTARKRASIS